MIFKYSIDDITDRRRRVSGLKSIIIFESIRTSVKTKITQEKFIQNIVHKILVTFTNLV